MANTQDIIIEVKTNMADSIDALAKLQQELDAVKVEQLKVEAAFKSGQKTREQADKELEVLRATHRSLSSDMKAVRKDIDDQTKAFKSAEGSLVQMRGQLASMRKEYESLSKAERESATGTQLLEKIANTTDELKKLEAAQGDFRRYVGNYQSALQALDPALAKSLNQFTLLSNGTMKVGVALRNGIAAVEAFGAQLLKLLANPIVAAFAAIAAVVMKLVDAFKKNDEAMTALSRAFAAFKPILDVINKGFQALANVAAKALNAIADGVKTLMSWIPGLKEYAQANDDIVVSTDKLEDAERQYAENHAEREAKIAELREKAADSENESFEDRKKALKEAQKLEKEDLNERKKNATEKVRIAEKQALLEIGATKMTKEAWDKLTDEQKNNITQLRTELANADKEYSTAVRKFKKEEQSLTKQEESERQQRAKAAAEAAKDRANKEKEALRNLQDLYVNSLTDAEERAYSITKIAGERQIEDLKNRLRTEKNLTETARRALNESIRLMEADLQLKLGKLRDEFNKSVQKGNELKRTRHAHVLLSALDDEEMIMKQRIKLNEWETQELIDNDNQYVNALEETWKTAKKDLDNLDDDGLIAKYSGAWDLYQLQGESAMTKMRHLVDEYRIAWAKAHTEQAIYTMFVVKASENEEKRIRDEYIKGVHKRNVTEISLKRKHAEILRAIELESFSGTELEKTKLLQTQAQERLRIANEEYQQRLADRKKYTTQELIAIYGSLDAYENAVAEANLKVVESENAVKDAVKDVANASADEKIAMIENSKAIMSSVDSILGSFQDLFTTMAESDEDYADFATGMALMQILVSTAISIANAIQGATAAGSATGAAAPFTTPAFITEMIAIVTGAMVSATTTLMRAEQQKKSAPKFADGGLIGGEYASTREEGRRDDVTIKASRGEYIVNADAVKRYGVGFLDSINGGSSVIGQTHFADGGYISQLTASADNSQMQISLMSDLITDSIAEIRPVVSVQEITKAQNRITIAEKTSRK